MPDYQNRTPREVELGVSWKARSAKLFKMPATYVAMDFETTGLDPMVDGIIEIAGVKVMEGEIVDTFQTLVATDAILSSEATKVNGITRDMLKGEPNIGDSIVAFIDFADGLPMLGHNAKKFDRAFMEHACAATFGAVMPEDWYDTMEVAQSVFGQRLSLKDLCARCGVTNDTAHRALSDAVATHECYQWMRRAIAEVTTDARDFPKPSGNGTLSGEVICLTGECEQVSRHDLMSRIVEHGGTLSNNVTLKTTMLVNLDERESSKVKKAREYKQRTGISILSGRSFLPSIGLPAPEKVPQQEAEHQMTEVARATQNPAGHNAKSFGWGLTGCGCLVSILLFLLVFTSCMSSCVGR